MHAVIQRQGIESYLHHELLSTDRTSHCIDCTLLYLLRSTRGIIWHCLVTIFYDIAVGGQHFGVSGFLGKDKDTVLLISYQAVVFGMIKRAQHWELVRNRGWPCSSVRVERGASNSRVDTCMLPTVGPGCPYTLGGTRARPGIFSIRVSCLSRNYVYTHIYIYIYVYICVYMYMCISLSISLSLYIYTCMCMYMCIYIYIYVTS